MGFPSSSAGKEFSCNAEDPSSIPGSGRYPGDGTGYPLQYYWAILVAQTVKNLSAMWEVWVQTLGCEDSPGEGNSYLLQYSVLDCIVHGVVKSWTATLTFHFHFICPVNKPTLGFFKVGTGQFFISEYFCPLPFLHIQ